MIRKEQNQRQKKEWSVINKGKNDIKKEDQHVHTGVNKVIDDHGIVFGLSRIKYFLI